ncbi:MAG: transporter substrate-binding domain-containing protein [Candidatus Azobacteroides sp.]|nr:transporter substrate-binding domain-containing protein [Candidatus Azobacteroides sp.]
MKRTIYFLLIAIGFAILCWSVYAYKYKKKENQAVHLDLPQIKETGQLTALTLSSSVTYFIYKGEEMGYDYELIKSFAESQNLNLKIKVAENENRLMEMLEAGEGDVVAYNIPVTNPNKEKFIYCGQEIINKQVLVQRTDKKNTILTDVTELIGKDVWVIDKTKYYQRLVNLNNELGGGINIRDIEKDTVSVEDLIEMVSAGTIPYTLSDNDIAKLNKTYYSNININLEVSHPQRSSWVVNKASPQLAKALDEWFENDKNTSRYRAIMKRYFEMSKMPGGEPAPILGKGKISNYDDIFKKYASSIDWDWKLLASMAYQESKFKLNEMSWAGAVGLMGLMPQTAEAFGITPQERVLPDPSVKAGVAYIKSLQRSFTKVDDKNEQIRFILASYNAGIAHILDAQALAGKYGKNPYLWDGNVVECLKWKQLPEYYNDSVCKYGYFRGVETLNYIRQVIDRWEYYKKKVNQE